jgi:hypothetical protein
VNGGLTGKVFCRTALCAVRTSRRKCACVRACVCYTIFNNYIPPVLCLLFHRVGGATWRTDRLERSGGSSPRPLVQTSFKSFQSLSFSAPPGREMWTSRMPLEPKTGTRNVRWVSRHTATEPPPWHATKPEVKNYHGGLPRDGPGAPIEVNASLHLTPNPNSAPDT